MTTATVCRKCGGERRLDPCGQFRCYPCTAARARAKRAADPEARRRYNARAMARYRLDPEKRERIIASSRKAYHSGGAAKQKQAMARLRQEQPFVWRARLFRNHYKAPMRAEDLQSLWDCQGGRCALTGRPILIADAHLDHVIPVSRGGSHELANLRWLSESANRAKGKMTDEEFFALCGEVTEWIARQKGIET